MSKHDLRCMQFADSACKLIQRVTDYLLQQHQKLFEPFGNGTPHAIHFYFIFIGILQAVVNTLSHAAKRI